MPRRLTRQMVGEERDPALDWTKVYQRIDEQLAQLEETRRARQDTAGVRQAGEIRRATSCALEVFDKWGDGRGEGPASQKWIEWGPFCEAMASRAAEIGVEIGSPGEWILVIELLHGCNRAVTVSSDRTSLILHRDMVTEYDDRAGE